MLMNAVPAIAQIHEVEPGDNKQNLEARPVKGRVGVTFADDVTPIETQCMITSVVAKSCLPSVNRYKLDAMVGTLSKGSHPHVTIVLWLVEPNSQWLFHLLGAMDFRLDYVYLKSGKFPSTWGALVDSSVKFLAGVSHLPSVTVVFDESQAQQWPPGVRCCQLVQCRGLQKRLPGYSLQIQHSPHWNFGGVTDATLQLFVFLFGLIYPA
jgi:hypothetical protein